MKDVTLFLLSLGTAFGLALIARFYIPLAKQDPFFRAAGYGSVASSAAFGLWALAHGLRAFLGWPIPEILDSVVFHALIFGAVVFVDLALYSKTP